MCSKLLHWKLKKECRNTKPLKTHITANIRSTVSVHSPQQLQRILQQHQTCRTSTLTLAPSKRCSITQRQCNQPSMDVLIEIRRACLGYNVVPSISDARLSGRRQRVRSVAEQIESLNCNRHGLLCSCQQQSLHSVGGHYNVRLFKLSLPKRRRNFTNFPLTCMAVVEASKPCIFSFHHLLLLTCAPRPVEHKQKSECVRACVCVLCILCVRAGVCVCPV